MQSYTDVCVCLSCKMTHWLLCEPPSCISQVMVMPQAYSERLLRLHRRPSYILVLGLFGVRPIWCQAYLVLGLFGARPIWC